MKVKGYIFDYGGTIDTNGCHWGKMLWHAYETCDVPVTEAQFREAYVYAERTLGQNPIIQTDYNFHKTLEVKIRIEFDYLLEKGILMNNNFGLASYRSQILNTAYEKAKTTVADSKKVLLVLKESYPLVLVSNFYGNLSVVLEEFGLQDIFDHVIESAAVGVRKPNPAIFQMGVEALSLPADSVAVVGDSLTKDIIPAKKVGCRTIWLKGEGWDAQPEMSDSADYVIKNLTELTRI